MIDKISISTKLQLIQDTWSPKIISELNGQYIKLAKLEGELVWHNHEQEDELFIVLEGELIMQFRENSVHLTPGEMIIVPKGVDHSPKTDTGASVLLFEPVSTKHTGAVMTNRTVSRQDWI